jgi:tetratricopeptide (TPR) repeat protein
MSLYKGGDLRRACPEIAQEAQETPTNPVPRLYLLGCAIHGRSTTLIRARQEALDKVAPLGAPTHQTAGDWLASGGYCAEGEREFSLGPAGDTAAVRFALGQCYQAVGNATEAVADYEKALQLDPNKEDYYLSLAVLLMAGGKPEEAGNVLLQSAAHFPDSVRTLIAMSLLHLELGYPDRARLGYEKAKELAPESPAVWKLLGRIQMAEGTYEDAAASFQHSASIDGTDAQTYLLLGMAEMKIEGGSDRALAAFKRANTIDSKLNEARILAASVYLQNKRDLANAKNELLTVLSSEPDSIQAHRLLMQVYQLQGMIQKAAAEAAEVRRLSERESAHEPQEPH